MQIKLVTAAYGAKPLEKSVKSGKQAAPEKMAAVHNEQVEFSETSLNLQKLTEVVESIPDIRIELVEKIKNKIKHNGYPLESNLYKAVEKLHDTKII